MSNRRLVCEAAFGYGPFDTVPVGDWVELLEAGRPRLRAADWTFGRDSEFDHFTAGTASVLLSNRDRHLDPDNAASPHNGFLLPNVPVRLRSKQAPFTVVTWARGSNLVFIDLVPGRRPAIGDVVVVDVADATFDGTFTVTGHFGTTTITYGQVGADVSTTAGQGTVTEIADEFYGFVRDGWEQQIDTNQSDCRLELQDLLGVMGGYKLPDVFDHAILELDPVGYWVLVEGATDAEQVADLSGNGNDGDVVGNVKFGERQIHPGHGTSALFEVNAVDAQVGRIEISRSPLIADVNHMSVVATFIVRNVSAANNWRTLFIQGNGNAAMTGFQVDVDTNGEPHVVYIVNGTGFAYQPAVNVADGEGHIVFAQSNVGFGSDFGLAIDSPTLLTTAGTAAIGVTNGVGIGGYRGVQVLDHWDGWICAVAIYASVLTSTQRTTIHDGFDHLHGQTSNMHIAWALDRLGVPAGRRNLDTGSVIMGPAETRGVDALEWMRDVTETEGGGLYIDHRDGGKVRYTNRYARFLATRSVTAQATFSDQTGAAVVRYPAEGLDIAPNGLDGIINQVTASWAGGEVVVEDAASVTANGPRPRTIETVATTANQARSAAEWVIANYKDPRSRIRGAASSDRSMQARNDRVEALRIDDRVTFRIQPMKTGTVTEVDLFVDGVSHSARGVEWDTSFRFAPDHTFTPWIWGTSAWNTTAFWG